MNPFSILMFCFSGALFLYAVLLYITKDYKLIPRGYVSKTDDKQAYTKQVAEIVALVAVAPAHCGYIALFSMGWSVVVLIVEMVLGNKNNAVTGLFLIVYGIIDPVATGGCVRTGEIDNVRNQNHNQRLDRLDRREGQRRALVSR